MTAAPDYYELLGIPLRLSLSFEDLQKRFYELSRQWHPDRFARRPAADQEHALEMSAQLNDAFRTLRDPIQRAEYVLTRNGLVMAEQRTRDVPPELLEEVFELNLALEEIREGDASARPQLEQAGRNFNAMLAGIDREIETLFEEYDRQPGRDALARIRGVLNRRKYIQNLVREVASALAA